MIKSSQFLAYFMLIISQTSMADTPANTQSSTEDQNDLVPQAKLLKENNDTTLGVPLAEPNSDDGARDFNFSFTADKDDKKAGLDYFAKYKSLDFKLGLSTSTKPETTTDTPATFDSLSSGTKFIAGLSWNSWKPKLVDEDEVKRKLHLICKEDWIAANPGKEYNLLKAASCTNDVLKNSSNKQRFDTVLINGIKNVPIWQISIESALNQNSFDYLDANDLNFDNKKTDSHNNYDINFKVARYDMESRYLLAVGLKYEKTYTGQTADEICLDMGNNNLRCRTIAIGAPEKKRHEKYYIEYRKLYKSWAIDPLIWHDVEGSITGVVIPLYLARNKDNMFNGGVKVEWNDDSNDEVVSFFITAPLTLQ